MVSFVWQPAGKFLFGLYGPQMAMQQSLVNRASYAATKDLRHGLQAKLCKRELLENRMNWPSTDGSPGNVQSHLCCTQQRSSGRVLTSGMFIISQNSSRS